MCTSFSEGVNVFRVRFTPRDWVHIFRTVSVPSASQPVRRGTTARHSSLTRKRSTRFAHCQNQKARFIAYQINMIIGTSVRLVCLVHCRHRVAFATQKLESDRAVSETDPWLPLYWSWRIRIFYNFRQNHQVEVVIASSPGAISHPSPSSDQIIDALVATDVTVQHDAINVFAKICTS